jgi:hypothetical protein
MAASQSRQVPYFGTIIRPNLEVIDEVVCPNSILSVTEHAWSRPQLIIPQLRPQVWYSSTPIFLGRENLRTAHTLRHDL